MNRAPFPSTPPSQPSPYRYLGRGGGERPVRVQIIIALVAGLILVAVPLYLWRRPQPESLKSAEAATVVDAGFVSLDASIADAAPAEPEDGIKLSAFNTIRCQNPGPGKTPPERCDHIPYFEDALARAIRESRACAPVESKAYDVSFVFEMHFGKKTTKLYLGKSTTLKRAKANELLSCVQRALPTPQWEGVRHEHAKYVISVLATYSPHDVF